MRMFEEFGFDDSWLLPEEAFQELEQQIQAGDLEQAKTAASKIADMKYGNAVMTMAISTATGQPDEHTQEEMDALCRDAGKSADDFKADLESLSAVVTKRLALNKTLAEIFNQ